MAIGVGYEFATEHGISRSCWSRQGAEVTHTGTLRKGDAFTMRIRLGADRLSQTNETLVGLIASRSSVRSWLEGANRVSEVDTNGTVSVSKQVNDPASFRWLPASRANGIATPVQARGERILATLKAATRRSTSSRRSFDTFPLSQISV